MNFKSLPDDILLIHLRMDEERAFHEIYLRYWKKVYIIANRKLKSDKVAEEVTQDIFLKLWENRKTQQIKSLDFYLMASVRNAIINQIRTSLTHEKFVDYAEIQYNKVDSSTEQLIELNELIATIDQYLKVMPEKTREIFSLNRLQYHSVKEISAKLNIPERTVEYHITQALRTLKAQLKDYLPPMVILFLLG